MVDIDVPELTLQQRTSLPDSPALSSLTHVLDALNAMILVLDADAYIRFFNQAYLEAYSGPFLKAGISAECLLGMQLPNNEEVNLILHTIRTGKELRNHYFHEIEIQYSGLADILPIESDVFAGAIVVMQETKRLREMSRKIAHYKNLAGSLQQELNAKEHLPPRFQGIIGSSVPFVKVLKMGAQVAPTKSSVCILGESGTGKEVFAEAIHYTSSFAEGPLIKVNCAAIPESLMESELFGYEKGAFTGASASGNPGKFELANNGTLFLDEVGEMPLSMQVKLLRVLQEREITRIGGKKPLSSTSV